MDFLQAHEQDGQLRGAAPASDVNAGGAGDRRAAVRRWHQIEHGLKISGLAGIPQCVACWLSISAMPDLALPSRAISPTSFSWTRGHRTIFLRNLLHPPDCRIESVTNHQVGARYDFVRGYSVMYKPGQPFGFF